MCSGKNKSLLSPWGLTYHFYGGRRSTLSDSEKLPDKFRRKTFFRTIGSLCSTILGHKKRDDAGLKKDLWGKTNVVLDWAVV